MTRFSILPADPGPRPDGTARVCGVQMDIAIGEAGRNLETCHAALSAAKGFGATHVVFPECALTGYCFDDETEARAAALDRRGAELDSLREACREHELYVVVGWLERTAAGLANAASLFGPGDEVHYHKTHLPHLGVDRFVDAGCGPFEVMDAGPLRLGVLVCYDASFPEATRALALAGADLVVLPTNWPQEAQVKADWLPNTRAYENVIYFATVNRIGEERGFRFHGRSRLCDPKGNTLVQAPDDAEVLLWADVDPRLARTKRIERRGSDYHLDRIADRRTDLYHDP